MIKFELFEFADVVKLPANYVVLDMSSGPMKLPASKQYAIGKYNERRPDIYTTGQYEGIRDNHIGIDIFAPENTEISSFYDGVVCQRAYNALPLDYGNTLVIEYTLNEHKLYALYGHLSKSSFDNNPPGKKIKKGQVFAWMGNSQENGGWPVHLHLQLSYEKPTNCDVPGVVSTEDLPQMLAKFPDPQLVLGKLY